ncbi:hypothetical protein ACKAV7_014654 [Fusarium commune]
MMETAWAKLADYYELTKNSQVYSAATVLNPSLNLAHMEKIWEDKKPPGRDELDEADASHFEGAQGVDKEHHCNTIPSVRRKAFRAGEAATFD